MITSTFINYLSGFGLARRVVDATFVRYARWRVGAIDSRSSSATQHNALLRLVRQAADTKFGRDHDFATIRSVADYQARVPLREYEHFWEDYWQPAFPHLNNVTWPGRIPYLALSSGTTTGSTKYIPVSSQMLASNRKAALTGLAWFRAAHPEAALFHGRMFFLGGSTDLTRLGSAPLGPLAGDLSGIAVREVSALLRPYTFPPAELALVADWEKKLDLLARQSARLPITLVSGVPSWLLVLFERLRQVTGKELITDIWPSLRVILHGGTSFQPYRTLFQRLVGDGVRFLEVYPASEGFIAADDPRHGFLRLVPDHGIFFEFVPVNELDHDKPTRHTLADIIPGVQYAVVLTTCAGLWSYVLGDTVCFESRDPPLLRFTGRTKQFLSAFGEHLIVEEVERAVTHAATAVGAEVTDFHVGPEFPDHGGSTGRHHYLVEFTRVPRDLSAFARELDGVLCRINEDYRAHRAGDLTLLAPAITSVPRGSFASWMRSRGKLGGQHKVPRLDNSGQLTKELGQWLREKDNHMRHAGQIPECVSGGRP